ncbi:hypothetical protein B0T25DRAFT_223172 [Lasiosphaeria hispida]|uniref:Microtubule associated protein n=1 Tax=Lasiosphaeria hispida TaxID=260671 RepID=A0AAJ0MEY7_9PEZI|nr:hypothetical protein B0T25DRAFT_223172 [Lasiosphaeria hispida]
MAKPDRPPANGFVAAARKVYNPIGFAKGYNFVLFFIFAGAMMGFVLARFQYLDHYGTMCRTPGIGECYWSTKGISEIGLRMHLAAILPAGFLVCFQFVPAIRHKALLFHRISGYLILILSLVSTIGAFMTGRHAFGGGLDIQLGVGVIGISFTVCMVLAYINIKRLQIEQHRAWMLRGWFYAASIITLRLIMIIMANIVSSTGEYYASRPCAQVDYTLGENRTRTLYPGCDPYYTGQNLDQYVLIPAKIGRPGTNSATAAAALGESFGAAFWLAFFLHAVGIEVYLRLTPYEHDRLRNVSYQRQKEAGMRSPGSAGLTADRLGDATPWEPASAVYQESMHGSNK